jgi:hypothetical protein
MAKFGIGGWAAVLCLTIAQAVAAENPNTAIVTRDQAALRAGPHGSARQQAVLWQGEMVEVRGERMDYLQVYDYRRERGGYVHASQVHRLKLSAEEAPELLSIVRFVRDTPGAEALGIGFAMAYIQAAPAEMVRGEPGIEALDALGAFADRLARRASSGAAQNKSAETTLSAHLDVAARYGVRLLNHERAGRMQFCYDGDAFRRVLAMRSTPGQRARAVLGLTRHECVAQDLGPLERNRVDEWRAEVLDRVDAAALPGYLMNRVLMRRAGVWSSLAYQRARNGDASEAAATRALAELAGVNKLELTDGDLLTYKDTAMRVSASRWAATPVSVAGIAKRAHIVTTPGQPGETCISLVDGRDDETKPLARRCTYGIVWAGSATLNREGNALAVAVQPLDTWREVWVFRKDADGWKIGVLPPAGTMPDIGCAEFAGWVPGGRHMLLAREARGDGKYQRNFEVMRLDTLAIAHQAADPTLLGAFQRWQDPSWKRQTLSLR